MNFLLCENFFLDLYTKFSSSLKIVRQEQKLLYKQSKSILYLPNLFKHHTRLRPQLDDIEAELTYLLIRERSPETIVEISPCGGWSSTWMLRALRDNNHGSLYSYDLITAAKCNVPKSLSAERWHFFPGDIKQNLKFLPSKIDYLFIDSDHSADFANWYINDLFPLVKPGTLVSVHDVFHDQDPGGFDEEGKVIIDWLQSNKRSFVTFSKAKNPHFFAKALQTKDTLGLAEPIHPPDKNSMIFFLL